MLGKLALKQGEPSAVTWFQKTRSLAKEGFADSLGMAADSYGWEGRSEWKLGHPEKAAPLFLRQLSLGDPSAIVSLKALVPDRAPVEGLLNYGPDQDELAKLTEAEVKELDEKKKTLLAQAARDPLLRRLVTVHILCTAADTGVFPIDKDATGARAKHWLEAISAQKLPGVPDAEYLGWVAYNAGDYAGAERWLALAASPDAPAAAWLRAKLERRAGKLVEAARSMELVWKGIERPSDYYGWTPADPEFAEYDRASLEAWSLRQSAGGDLAASQLARADFLQAFDTFRRSELPGDAAYLAEHVLTADELKAWVDKLPPKTEPAKAEPEGENARGEIDWRYLLGRRLVREDRYEEAAGYLPEPYRKVLAIYAQALKEGADAKQPAAERAKAWFKAAWIARHDGMELMGTQEAPDGFATEGSFESIDLAEDREGGIHKTLEFGEDGRPNPKIIVVQPKPTKEELKRLAQNKIRPNVRFHYRIVAGSLALKAAALLPDNSEELADVLNTAGDWVTDRDDKMADRIFDMLRKRAGRTVIGKQLIAKKWFQSDLTGPWSERETQEHEAMMKEAKPEKAEK
jgi:hypothetical protein